MTDTQQSVRIWTGNDGKFEVEAAYVGLFQNTKVKLRKQGGGMIAVPLDRLCEADVAYIAARSGLSSLAPNRDNKGTATVMQKPDNPKDITIPSPTLNISFADTVTSTTAAAFQSSSTKRRPSQPHTNGAIPPLPVQSSPPQPETTATVPIKAIQALSVSTSLPPDGYFSTRPHEQPVSTPPAPSMAQVSYHYAQPQQQQIISSHTAPMIGCPGYSQEQRSMSTPPPPSLNMANIPVDYPQQQQQQQNYVMSPPPMTSYSSYSQQQYSVPVESNGTIETLILTEIEHGGPQRVRAMRPESIQLLSQRSLSSITEKLVHSPQGQWQPRPQTLAAFPPAVLTNIGRFLDARTRVRLGSVCRSFRQAMFRPPTWRHIWFSRHDLYKVDTGMIYAMTQTLMGYQLYHAVYTINLDGSAVTADAVVHVLLNFLSLRTLSVKGCWQVHSFPLGGKLMQIAATGQLRAPIQLEQIELGKALRRGIDRKELENKPNAPQSFGQDVAVIRTALEQLASRPIQIDCYLCDFCHSGATGPMLMCVACGPMPIHKCTNCAPKCDRCAVRVCNMPQCRARSIQITTTKCSQCEKSLSICNQRHSQACVDAKKPCEKCQGVYHVQCRANDGGYISNQCSRCGKVACPTCDLTGCAGGCLGQWCRDCVNDAGLAHCKCFVLERKTGGKMRKRNVCKNCRKGCAKCSTTGFCTRCLGVHSKQCR
ncbi:hypothetical protein BDB00DRAFT_832704 [Zychaea mexicana]|uniref:uncharacterized protein n=1 Tax=Zychaea mexicana TaxID=64656 RepID=UPI0022FDE0FA|nr:uncharacterized protein BDB00DRAFT_832704 [Zychaea mexicana]KAI9491544.1 hypothetical protein BDB00DRAFT_832704 [Zychaea mexicana]